MKIKLFLLAAFLLSFFSLAADPYAKRREVRSRTRYNNRTNNDDAKDKDDEGLPELHFRLPGGVILTLVRIPAGSFIFSAADGRNWQREKEVRVTLKKDYYIGKFEITQAQFKAATNTTPSHNKSRLDNPVESVSWNDAMLYCDRLTKHLAPKGWKFTLPTECQWEYAARAGSTSENVGIVKPKMRYRKVRDVFVFSGSNDIREVAWYDKNSSNHTHPVGQKLPNDFGLYDMTGNVWEWCLDDWVEDSRKVVPEFYRKNKISYKEPRMVRGGSYRNGDNFCRISFRQYKEASFRYRSLGFRIALVQLPGNTNMNPVSNYQPDKN